MAGHGSALRAAVQRGDAATPLSGPPRFFCSTRIAQSLNCFSLCTVHIPSLAAVNVHLEQSYSEAVLFLLGDVKTIRKNGSSLADCLMTMSMFAVMRHRGTRRLVFLPISTWYHGLMGRPALSSIDCSDWKQLGKTPVPCFVACLNVLL